MFSVSLMYSILYSDLIKRQIIIIFYACVVVQQRIKDSSV